MAGKQTRFPETWNDDARMTVLFAPFREKSLNPSSWDQKMTFWSNLIVSDCTSCGDIVIDVKTLPSRFERNGKTPACLSSVVDEMERTGKLKQVADTEMSPSNQGAAKKGWMTWGVDTFIKAPISMGWNLMTKPTIPSSKLVVVEALKSKCEEVCRLQCECMDCDITDSVIEYSDLWDRCRGQCKTEGEFYLVLKELEKDKRITLYHTDTSLLVKFPQRSECTAGPVTEQDIQIYSMKKASKVLLDRIEKLGKDVDKLTVEAKMHKRKDMKQYALRSLRQRRRTQNRMNKLSGSLDMIDDVLSRIQHAASDEMVLKALQAGSGALKTLTDRTGLDEVHRTMDNLAEILDQQNEIESEMNMSRIGDVSSDDLERELESLIGEQVASPQVGSVVSPENVNVSPPRGAPVTVSPENDVVGIADLLAGLDFGSPSCPTPSKQAGSPSGPTPSKQAGSPSDLTPSKQAGSPSDLTPSKQAGSPSGPTPSKQAGSPSGPTPSKQTDSPSGLNQTKQISSPSNDMADTTTKSELSCEICDLDFPDVPNFSPGTPEKSKDRQKTWTKLPQKEAALS